MQIFARMVSTPLLEDENISAENPVAKSSHASPAFASEQFFPVVSQRSISICSKSGVPWSLVSPTGVTQDRQVYGTKAIPKHSEYGQFQNQIPEQKKNWT